MTKVYSAENFAKERHSKAISEFGIPLPYDHLIGVVSRLKNLGIRDEDVLSAAWLHDIMNDTNTSLEELDNRFGSKVAVIVLALSKDKRASRSHQEELYMRQLREASLEAKLIKLCDISANIRDLKNSSLSKTKKTKETKKKLNYLKVIKPELIKNKSRFPGILKLIIGINEVISSYGLGPVIL